MNPDGKRQTGKSRRRRPRTVGKRLIPGRTPVRKSARQVAQRAREATSANRGKDTTSEEEEDSSKESEEEQSPSDGGPTGNVPGDDDASPGNDTPQPEGPGEDAPEEPEHEQDKSGESAEERLAEEIRKERNAGKRNSQGK